MKIKRIISLITSVVISIACMLSGFSANGQDLVVNNKSISLLYKDTVYTINVVVDSEKNIFMDTNDISKYTPFNYCPDNSTFYYDEQDKDRFCSKEIKIDVEKKLHILQIIGYTLFLS